MVLPGRTEERMPMTDRATMTVTQAATVLGISRTAAYECVRRGEIPSLRLGGRIIVPTQAVEELLTFGARQTSESPDHPLAEQRDTLF